MDIQMTGPDVFPPSPDDDEDEEGSFDEAFSTLWAQFPSDMVQQSPNFRHRTQPAYIKLTLGERDEVSIDLFKSFELPFDSVYLRLCTPSQWRELVFDKFFPPQDMRLPDNLQNFRQCRYFGAYTRELGRLLPSDATKTRGSLWTLFQDLRWVPHPYSERMWATKRRNVGHGWFALPHGHHDLAVHIAINPKYYVSLDAITLSSGPRPAPTTEEDDNAAWEELSHRIQFIRQSVPHPDSIIQPGEGQHILTTINHISQSNSGSAQSRPNAPSRRTGTPNFPQRREEAESDADQESSGLLPARQRGGLGSLPPPLRPGRVPAVPGSNRRNGHGRASGGTGGFSRSSGAPSGHASPAASSASRAGRHPPVARSATNPIRQPAPFRPNSRVSSTPSEPELARGLARTVTPFDRILGIPSSPVPPPHEDLSDLNPPSTPPQSDHIIDLSSPEIIDLSSPEIIDLSSPEIIDRSSRRSSAECSLHHSEVGSSNLNVLTSYLPSRVSTPPPLPLLAPTTPRKTVRVRNALSSPFIGCKLGGVSG